MGATDPVGLGFTWGRPSDNNVWSSLSTGHSYKQHEVIETSYRLTLSSRQTYIKLVDGGWVFDVGVRGSYKDKPIMRCIATEAFVAEEEAERDLRGRAGRFAPIPRPFKLADDSIEISPDGMTVFYKDLAGDQMAAVRGTTSIPVAAPAGRPRRRPNYFEVRVQCAGARQDMCVGLWGGRKEEAPSEPPGVGPQTFALHLKDWAVWASGERLFSGRDRLLLEGSGRVPPGTLRLRNPRRRRAPGDTLPVPMEAAAAPALGEIDREIHKVRGWCGVGKRSTNVLM